MTIGRLLGSGNVAEVFEWGADVIKLYRAGWGKEQAFREAATLALLEGGVLPVPDVHGVLQVDGRWGVVMSRAPGRPVGADMLENPAGAPALLEAVVELQVRMHGEVGRNLPGLHDRLRQKISGVRLLSVDEACAMLGRLEALPGGDRLCHGDFHPFNVMGTIERPVIVDWLDATSGAPEADACRSYLLLLHNAAEAASMYLEAYLRLSGRSREDVLA